MNREQKIENLVCTCGAGHGSIEGHTKWCKWHHVQCELQKLGPGDPPRRIRVDLYTRPETAIREAVTAVEYSGAHPLLTDAVALLSQAQEKVAEYIDLPDSR